MARVSRRFREDSRHATTMSYAVVAERVKKKPVIDLTLGQPDIQPPQSLVELLAVEARGINAARYPPPQGLRELREALARYMSEFYGVDAEPEDIVVLSGAKPGIAASMYAVCDPGDAVLIFTPHFYAYVNAARMLGLRPVLLRLSWREERLGCSLEEVKRVFEEEKPCLAIINTPHNPTGLHMDRELVKTVVDLAEEKGAMVLSDEVYVWLVYRGVHEPLVKNYGTGTVIHLESFSKTLAVPGWRIGFIYADHEVARAVTFFNSNVYTGVPRFIQLALAKYLEAYREDMVEFIERARRLYERRAQVVAESAPLLEGLVELYEPEAGFFLFPRVKGLMDALGTSSVEELVGILAREAGVLTVPGTVFGSEWREYIRLSLTAPEARLREAISRIAGLARRGA